MVERAHRQLKDALKARMAATDWPQHLPWVLLDINNAPEEDSGKSTAVIVYGTTLTLPEQLAANQKQPVEEILWDLTTTIPATPAWSPSPGLPDTTGARPSRQLWTPNRFFC